VVHGNAVVIGSGPNGLAAAIVLAQAGMRVTVFEAETHFGGGARSAELTLPGFEHDICSAIHPLAAASPFFETLPLAGHGLSWIHPPAPLAHPLDDGTAVMLERSLEETAHDLGDDAGAYRRLVGPIAADWNELRHDLLAPLGRWPRRPLGFAAFGLRALRTAHGMAISAFQGERARALFGGLAAHAMLPLTHAGSAAVPLVLAATAHAVGWPMPRGGAQRIADALVSYLRTFGAEMIAGRRIGSLDAVAPASLICCDLTPRGLLRLAGDQFPERYRRALGRYRYGMAAFKVDYALDGPIPWRAPECARAATVHLGGTLSEIVHAEQAVWDGTTPARPFVLLVQPTLFDPSRAPEGRHIAWAYCHVPNSSTEDMTDRIERQIERFAPGFRDRILARSVLPPMLLERHNANLVGGDINGGVADLGQIVRRPTWRRYVTPLRGVYLCSSSTPPGGGVHGMCGYWAARTALRGPM
jgi:phytoene dehydrogenase-like protein